MDCPNWREIEALAFEETASQDGSHTVVIVGAGPVGLTLAIDLAQRGVPSVVLEQRTRLADGSRAICWSRRTLDTFNRIGIADVIRKVGAQWQVGRVYHKKDEIYHLRLTPDTFPENPFFVNFQQSLCEYLLVQEAGKHATIDLRWGHELQGLEQHGQEVVLTVKHKTGVQRLEAKYVVACDGAKSFVRHSLGLGFEGRKFQDRFLIADIEMKGDFPQERRFWFEPPFHSGQSTLLHKQAQDIWRVDFQLDTQGEVSAKQIKDDSNEKTVRRRIQAFLGRDDLQFEIVWSSVYFFTCQRLDRFRYGNIFFAGDSAHVVSPFGARGGNGGIEDANNLGWKLAEVIGGRATASLLDSYEAERIPACDDNILNSSRTTDFMTPKSKRSKRIRDTVLNLARRHEFAKRLVNSGRMSVPYSYNGIGMFDHPAKGSARVRAGDAGVDVPLLRSRGGADGYLLRQIRDYTMVAYQRPMPQNKRKDMPAHEVMHVGEDGDWQDARGLMAQYYFAPGGGYALFRPDQYLLGVWNNESPSELLATLKKIRNGEAGHA